MENTKVNLRQRVISSGFWVLGMRIGQRILNFIKLLVLGRLLSPQDFGLLGIALLSMSIMDTFSQTGFHQALIQKRETIDDYLDSAWSFLVLRGVMIFTILYFSAPYIANFFNAPKAKAILQIIAFAPLLESMTNIGTIHFSKELEFNKQFQLQFSGTCVDFVVSITLAILYRNVWALAGGLVAGYFTRCIVSYCIHAYRPLFKIDFRQVKELLKFGRWIFGSTILAFLITQGDDIIVGKMLGVVSLGFYQMAYRLSNLSTTEITHVISQVSFPTYAKLQGDAERLRNAYLRVLQITTFFSFPIGVLIYVLSYDLTVIFLQTKWIPMVPALKILVIWGLDRSIGACTGPLFQALGKPALATMMQFIRLIILAILIFPMTSYFGIVGAAMAVTISGLCTRPVTDSLVIKLIKCSKWQFVQQLVFPLAGSLIMSASLIIIKHSIFPVPNLLGLAVLILCGIVVYAASVYVSRRLFGYAAIDTLRNLIVSKLRKRTL